MGVAIANYRKAGVGAVGDPRQMSQAGGAPMPLFAAKRRPRSDHGRVGDTTPWKAAKRCRPKLLVTLHDEENDT